MRLKSPLRIVSLKITLTRHCFKNGKLVISFIYYLQRCDMETFSLSGTGSAKTGTGKGVYSPGCARSFFQMIPVQSGAALIGYFEVT